MTINRRRAAAIWIIAVCAFAAGTAFAQDKGSRDYALYCSSCHGARGKGDGPALYVIPMIKPTDLTQLAKTTEVYSRLKRSIKSLMAASDFLITSTRIPTCRCGV